MKIFTEKLFAGEQDQLVHLQFQKFSKGIFEQRAVVDAKNSKGKYSINTTNEYANELVRALAEQLGNKRTKVTGVIVTAKDLRDQLEFEDMKQFMGVKQYAINKELSGNEIIKLLDQFPTAFFALSLSSEDSELKTKAKAPKSAKPSSKGEGEAIKKADFCKLKTTNKNLAKSILFGAEEGKDIHLEYTFNITEIEVPKGITDSAAMREAALKKGKIIRKEIVDGKEKITEAKLVA